MKGKDRSGKLAVILHADIAGSTRLVQKDEQQAHARITEAFQRFGSTIEKYHGYVRELRGDALLGEFERASDAVTAALAFQAEQAEYNAGLEGGIKPEVRVGIAMGEVIIADDTITGAGVILAQRIEQLTEPGGVGIQGAAYETIPGRFPYEFENMGEHALKGFDNPVRLFSARLRQNTELPSPPSKGRERRGVSIWVAAAVAVAVGIGAAVLEHWHETREATTPAENVAPVQDRLSIVVLPFENLNGDGAEDGFARGITEDLMTALSGLPGLFVVSHKTAFNFEGKSASSRDIARELGVRYLLEGSVRLAGTVLRVNVELVDGSTDVSLWAMRYDGSIDETLTFEDEVIESVVEQLTRELGPEIGGGSAKE